MRELDFAQFARYGVATVYEAAGQQGLIDETLLQIVPGSKVAGPALTVRCATARADLAGGRSPGNPGPRA